MVDKICNYLTNKIRNKMPEITDERAEAINFGLQLLIGEIPKTFAFIFIAWLLGVLKEFFITVLVIFPYRALAPAALRRCATACRPAFRGSSDH